jgi:hypothetical protein
MKEGFEQLVQFQNVTSINSKLETFKYLLECYQLTGGNPSEYQATVKKLLDSFILDFSESLLNKR